MIKKIKELYLYFAIVGLILVVCGLALRQALFTNLGIVISLLCLTYQNYRVIKLSKCQK